jgi:hypothetical protein
VGFAEGRGAKDTAVVVSALGVFDLGNGLMCRLWQWGVLRMCGVRVCAEAPFGVEGLYTDGLSKESHIVRWLAQGAAELYSAPKPSSRRYGFNMIDRKHVAVVTGKNRNHAVGELMFVCVA